MKSQRRQSGAEGGRRVQRITKSIEQSQGRGRERGGTEREEWSAPERLVHPHTTVRAVR